MYFAPFYFWCLLFCAVSAPEVIGSLSYSSQFSINGETVTFTLDWSTVFAYNGDTFVRYVLQQNGETLAVVASASETTLRLENRQLGQSKSQNYDYSWSI